MNPKRMKPKTDLVLNSACLILLSPWLGIMVAGIIVACIEAILLTVAVVCGFIASIFFNVNLTSLAPQWDTVKTISMWVIFVGGTLGGIIWSFMEVGGKWKRHSIHGTGW